MHGESTPERWRAVADCPDYDVSDHGNMRTWRAQGHPYRTASPRPMRPSPHHAGHPRVTMRNAANQKVRRLVPRLVLEAFVGPCPEGMECCHWDGDSSNNRLSNLRWDTHAANMADRDRHGRTQRGEVNRNSKLTADVVREIRARVAAGERYTDIAPDYGVDCTNIGCIARRVTWRHVP